MNEAEFGMMARRLESLEGRVRRSRMVSVTLGGLLAVVALAGWMPGPRTEEVIRARTLVIEDAEGRDRIVLGAPMPDPITGRRISPTVGMVINDTAGHERFGLGLQASGRVGMGFDAAPGDGDPRNPERLNLGVDGDGHGYVRYLDKRTGLAGYLGLREDDRVWLEFAQVSADSVIRRRVGLLREETLREGRRR